MPVGCRAEEAAAPEAVDRQLRSECLRWAFHGEDEPSVAREIAAGRIVKHPIAPVSGGGPRIGPPLVVGPGSGDRY